MGEENNGRIKLSLDTVRFIIYILTLIIGFTVSVLTIKNDLANQLTIQNERQGVNKEKIDMLERKMELMRYDFKELEKAVTKLQVTIEEK